MATANAQMWQGSKFSVERTTGDTPGEIIFVFTGPFTARDMYGSLAPIALHEILDSTSGAEPVTSHIFDLTRVPYIDSAGLGIVVDQFSRCQKAGIRLSAIGAGKHVLQQFRLTKIDTLFSVIAADNQPGS